MHWTQMGYRLWSGSLRSSLWEYVINRRRFQLKSPSTWMALCSLKHTEHSIITMGLSHAAVECWWDTRGPQYYLMLSIFYSWNYSVTDIAWRLFCTSAFPFNSKLVIFQTKWLSTSWFFTLGRICTLFLTLGVISVFLLPCLCPCSALYSSN